MTSTPKPSVPLLSSAPSSLDPPRERIPDFDPPDTEVRTASLKESCDDTWKLTGRVMGDAGTGRATITRSAREFSELIDGDISSAGAFNEEEWRKACLALTYAAATADLWREDVEEFRRERRNLIDRYSTAITLAGLSNKGDPMYQEAGPLQTPPTYGPHVPSPRQLAYYEVHREYMAKGRRLKDDLEETAGERAALLQEGPEPSNLKVLVEAGVLGWGAYNILGPERDVPLPVSTKEAERMAREMKSYLDGDKEPDARFHEIIAAIGAVSAKARKLQEANRSTLGQPYQATMHRPTLSEEELDFLETFYGQIEGQSPNGVVRLVPWLEGHDGPDWSDAQRKAFTGAMADGLLLLSDEKVGGGQHLLPTSVRNFADGVPSLNHDVRTGRHMSDPSGNWLADARDFGLLMAASNSDTHGGTEFSTNTTLSLGHHLANRDLDLHESYDKGLSALLDVTTRNEEANHRVLTDIHDHPMTRSTHEKVARLRGMPDFGSTSDALVGLYSHDWTDDGKAVAGLTDWIPEFSKGTSVQAGMAGHATVGLLESLAGNDEGKPFHDTGERSDTEYELSVTEINPKLAESLTEVYLTYRDDLTLDSDTNGYRKIDSAEQSLLLHDPSDTALFIKDETKTDFIQLLVADEKSAKAVTVSVGEVERNIIGAALESSEPSAALNAGANVGSMRTIVHDAMINEYVDRVDNRAEARQAAADRWQEGFNISVALSNGTLGAVPKVGPALAIAGESVLRLYEHPGKAQELEEWDQKNQGEELPLKEVVDYGPQSVQHAQLQLLDVMVAQGRIEPEDLVEKGLLPSEFDPKKDKVLPGLVERMDGTNKAGTYSVLMKVLEEAGAGGTDGSSAGNPVSDFFDGVRDYYAPDSKQDKGES